MGLDASARACRAISWKSVVVPLGAIGMSVFGRSVFAILALSRQADGDVLMDVPAFLAQGAMAFARRFADDVGVCGFVQRAVCTRWCRLMLRLRIMRIVAAE